MPVTEDHVRLQNERVLRLVGHHDSAAILTTPARRTAAGYPRTLFAPYSIGVLPRSNFGQGRAIHRGFLLDYPTLSKSRLSLKDISHLPNLRDFLLNSKRKVPP